MRPDLAAFRELDTLVRNLSDQLAGYRRRALAAESRVRELEQGLDEMGAAASRAQDRAESVTEQLTAAVESLRVEREAASAARAQVQQITKTATAASERAAAAEQAVVASEESAPLPPAHRAVVRENEDLKRRLDEASTRAKELGERLRFLRQQLATVPEK
ncbi:MAG: hypothetical protein ABI120_18715 [Gemmatimonadaceae bacterium]